MGANRPVRATNLDTPSAEPVARVLRGETTLKLQHQRQGHFLGSRSAGHSLHHHELAQAALLSSQLPNPRLRVATTIRLMSILSSSPSLLIIPSIFFSGIPFSFDLESRHPENASPHLQALPKLSKTRQSASRKRMTHNLTTAHAKSSLARP